MKARRTSFAPMWAWMLIVVIALGLGAFAFRRDRFHRLFGSASFGSSRTARPFAGLRALGADRRPTLDTSGLTPSAPTFQAGSRALRSKKSATSGPAQPEGESSKSINSFPTARCTRKSGSRCCSPKPSVLNFAGEAEKAYVRLDRAAVVPR